MNIQIAAYVILPRADLTTLMHIFSW